MTPIDWTIACALAIAIAAAAVTLVRRRSSGKGCCSGDCSNCSKNCRR